MTTASLEISSLRSAECVPVTITASLKDTVIAITSSTLYAPSDVLALTEAIVGIAVSITKALLAPNEPDAPGDAVVRVGDHYLRHL